MKSDFIFLKISIMLLLPLTSTGTMAEALPEPFRVIPQPQKVELLQGVGLAYGTMENLIMEGELFRPVMGPLLSQLAESKIPGAGTLTLKMDDTGLAPDSRRPPE